MSEARILSQAQAEAIYIAMCALNDVGARLDALFLERSFHAREMPDGRIVVNIVPNVTFPGSHAAEPEIHGDQAAFAAAYGISTNAQDSLQGAADWLVGARPGLDASTLAGKLSIGYNRARRLHEFALTKAAQ